MAGPKGFGRDVSVENGLLARAFVSLRKRSQMEMVFGGPVNDDLTALRITELSGTRTSSPLHLVVESGHGLGGKALATSRPMLVSNYFASEGITHIYDNAVRPEAIETLAAVPVVVGRAPRALIYLATRTQVALGDRWFDSLAPFVKGLAHSISIEDEVRRRLKSIAPAITPSAEQHPPLTRGDLRDMADELSELASQVADDDLRGRIETLSRRFETGLSERSGRDLGNYTSQNANADVRIVLRPREVQVLAEVARGSCNQEIAEALGLLPNTVKSYLKAAMGKLHAKNRMQAVLRACELGLL